MTSDGELYRSGEALDPFTLNTMLENQLRWNRAHDRSGQWEGSAAQKLLLDVKKHATELVNQGAQFTTQELDMTPEKTVMIQSDGVTTDFLTSYERVQLVTLQPQTYEEAVALLPPLARFQPDSLDHLIQDLVQRIQREA